MSFHIDPISLKDSAIIAQALKDNGYWDEVKKATYAYHFKQDEYHDAHRFLFNQTIDDFPILERIPDSFQNQKCTQCGRSRFLIRWDDLPGGCVNAIKPVDIKKTIYDEEVKYNKNVDYWEKLILKELPLTKESMFKLYSTYGITDIDLMFMTAEIYNSEHKKQLTEEFESRLEEDKQLSKSKQKKPVITLHNEMDNL